MGNLNEGISEEQYIKYCEYSQKQIQNNVCIFSDLKSRENYIDSICIMETTNKLPSLLKHYGETKEIMRIENLLLPCFFKTKINNIIAENRTNDQNNNHSTVCRKYK